MDNRPFRLGIDRRASVPEQDSAARKKRRRRFRIARTVATGSARFAGSRVRRAISNRLSKEDAPRQKRKLRRPQPKSRLKYSDRKTKPLPKQTARSDKPVGEMAAPARRIRYRRNVLAHEIDETLNDAISDSDNDGVKAANFYRKHLSRHASRGLRAGRQWQREHPRRAEAKRAWRETKEAAYELRHGKPSPAAQLRKKVMARRRQLQAFAEKKMGEKAAATTAKIIKVAAKAAVAIIRTMLVLVGFPLLFIVLLMLLVLMVVMLAGVLFNNVVIPITTCYTTSEADLEASSSYMTKLEAQLDYKIKSLPTAWEWAHIDYFHYYLDPIEHDPMALQGYLNVKYPGYTFEEVKTEIDYLFAQRYRLTLHEWSEVAGEEPDEYVVYHLDVTLVAKPLEPILQRELRLDPAQQLYEWYEVLMITQGGRQGVANPFGRDVDWRPYVSSLYGYRVDPEGFGVQLHRGLDIGLSGRVLAGVTGRVLHTGQDAVLGRYVVLAQEGTERRVQYGRCGTVLVSPGEDVAAGQTPVATAGGEDLHIEILDAGEYRNPIFYLMQPSLEVQQ